MIIRFSMPLFFNLNMTWTKMNEEFVIFYRFFLFCFVFLFREEKNLQIEIWEFHKSIVRRPAIDHWPSLHAQMSLISYFIVWRINIGNKVRAFIPFQEKKQFIIQFYIHFFCIYDTCMWCGVVSAQFVGNVKAIFLLLLLSRVNLIIDDNSSNINK